jgi:hypothetical protein
VSDVYHVRLLPVDLAAVSTSALTRSFGWSGAESFQQHDVQELARVLFDALERSLVGTPNVQLINDLFKVRLPAHGLTGCRGAYVTPSCF